MDNSLEKNKTDKSFATQITSSKSEMKTGVVEISFENQKSFSLKDVFNKIAYYGIPILGLGVFLIILVATVIPSAGQIISKVNELNLLAEESTRLDNRITKLISVRAQNEENKDVLEKINALIPTGKSEVVNFRQRIVETALANNVTIDSTKTGENLVIDEDLKQLSIIEIPSEFSLNGQFNSFRNFLNALYVGEDFFIINEMDLGFSPSINNLDRWFSDLSLEKYQFYVDQQFNPLIFYGQVSENEEPDYGVIEFIENRFL